MVAAGTVQGIHQGLDTHANRPVATAVAAGALYSCSTHSLIYKSDGATWATWGALAAGGTTTTVGVEFTIDGGGSAITTGIKGDIEIPFAWTSIPSVRLFADTSTTTVVNIWKDTYANFPPTSGDKITASAPPTLTAATKSQDTTLTGWTTTGSAGDILRINVDSNNNATRLLLSIALFRTL